MNQLEQFERDTAIQIAQLDRLEVVVNQRAALQAELDRRSTVSAANRASGILDCVATDKPHSHGIIYPPPAETPSA